MELTRPETAEAAVATLGNGALAIAGGTEVVPLLRERILSADTLVDLHRAVPKGVSGSEPQTRIGAGTTLGELEVDPDIPDALREACRLSASPQLRATGTIGGNLLQATRCWYWRLRFPCRLHGGDRCHAREGEHREHAIFANDFCASAHPSDPAAALLALGAILRTDRRELPLADLYRLPDDASRETTTLAPDELILELDVPRPDASRDTTTLAPDELILELDVPRPDASTYLKAMDRARWSFALVGVAAARFGGDTRIALSGVAPIPWLLQSLDDATPLPKNAYKLELAGVLVERARQALGAA